MFLLSPDEKPQRNWQDVEQFESYAFSQNIFVWDKDL